MKKIGILTYHNSYNHGANLQTLATQSILENVGVQPVIVNYIDNQKLNAFEKLVDRDQAEQHKSFAQKYYRLSPPLHSASQVEEYCLDELDAVIVGSDAVFRIREKFQPKRVLKASLGIKNPYESFNQGNDLSPYWLSWKKTHGKPYTASLAASSRGTSFYFLKLGLYKKLWSAIRSFDRVTVRDKWTKFMIAGLSLGTVEAEICPDPVFGLRGNFQLPAGIGSDKDLSNALLLAGSFEKNWVEELKRIADSLGYEIYVLPNSSDRFEELELRSVQTPMCPLEWYDCIAKCKGYIGERFHALVSAMSNNSPVITVDVSKNRFLQRNSRNPNYDLCLNSNTLERYFQYSSIHKKDPRAILDILLSSKSQKKSDRYADWCSKEVVRVLSSMIESID